MLKLVANIETDNTDNMWYVIQVYTGQEQEIVEKCKERVTIPGEEVFVMLGEKKYRIRGEWSPAYYRLFPGYIFFVTDDPDGLRVRLRNVKLMTKLLKIGEEITPIYPEEEELLKKIGGKEHIARYSEGYLEGEKLIVTEGALEGYMGKVKHIIRHQREVVIEVPLLGRIVEVKLGLGVVKRVKEKTLKEYAGDTEE